MHSVPKKVFDFSNKPVSAVYEYVYIYKKMNVFPNCAKQRLFDVLMAFKSIKYITFPGQWVKIPLYEHLSSGYI